LSTGIKGKAIFTSKSGLFLMASKRLNLLYSCRKICLQECEEKSLSIARSNEILGWEGVGNRQLLCFFTAWINWSMLTANLKFRAKESFFFSFFAMF
jgi:hypothetical protein